MLIKVHTHPGATPRIYTSAYKELKRSASDNPLGATIAIRSSPKPDCRFR